MKSILITGINGFLGKHLAKHFTHDYQVIGLDYSTENRFLIDDEKFKIVNSNYCKWFKLFEQNTIDIIIHTATYYDKNSENISKVLHTNMILPFQILDSAINSKVSVFINTDTVLDRYINPYALTKRHFQEWLFMRKNEICVINMKLEHFYGPGSSDNNFISSMIRRLKENEESIALTLGNQQRSFVFIDDVTSAYDAVIKYHPRGCLYSDYEVGSSELITIKNLVIKLKELVSSNSILNFGAIPYRTNEHSTCTVNNHKLMELGWRPNYDLASGLKKTLEKPNS